LGSPRRKKPGGKFPLHYMQKGGGTKRGGLDGKLVSIARGKPGISEGFSTRGHFKEVIVGATVPTNSYRALKKKKGGSEDHFDNWGVGGHFKGVTCIGKWKGGLADLKLTIKKKE